MLMAKKQSTCFDHLPDDVLGSIFYNLDFHTRTEIRLVCRRWLEQLEQLGLHFQIDDRDESSITLANSKCIASAEILHLQTTSKLHLQFPDFCEQLICCGPISSEIFINDLITRCKYLTTLKLCGSFWKNMDLPIGVFSKSRLKHLKNLVINVSSENILSNTELQDFMQNQDLYVPSLEKLNRFDRNLSEILNSIFSSKLVKVELRTGIEVVREPPEVYSYNWRCDPLESLLERHNSTLREIYMPSYVGKMCGETDPRIIPEKLTHLCLRNQKLWFQNDDYWKNLIRRQRDLKSVNLKFVDYSGKTLCFLVCWIAMKNEKLVDFTFRYGRGPAAPTWDCDDPSAFRKVTLDAKAFTNCTRLETIIIEAQRNQDFALYDSILDNFSAFPKSLKKIFIDGVLISNLEADDMLKFPQLEFLSLGLVSLASRSTSHSTYCSPSYYYGGVAWESLGKIQPFITACLLHRKLNYFCLRFWKNPPISKELREFLEQIGNGPGSLWNYKWLRSIHMSKIGFIPSCPCSQTNAAHRKLFGTFEIPDNTGTSNIVFVEDTNGDISTNFKDNTGKPYDNMNGISCKNANTNTNEELQHVQFTVNDNLPDEMDFYCYEAENMAKLGYPVDFYEEKNRE